MNASARAWNKAHPGYSAENTRRWEMRDPEGRALSNQRAYLKRHGMTIEDYDRLFEAQGGRCATCGTDRPGGRSATRFHVDHDHACCSGASAACGKCVRGLLCNKCNHALGLARDDPVILRSLAEY